MSGAPWQAAACVKCSGVRLLQHPRLQRLSSARGGSEHAAFGAGWHSDSRQQVAALTVVAAGAGQRPDQQTQQRGARQPARQPSQPQQQRQHPQQQSAAQQRRQEQPSQQPSGQQGQGERQRGCMVVVEGVNDMRAVRRAIPGAPVYVLGTSTAAGNARMVQELQAAAAGFSGVIVLTDPDVAGRQARRLLDESLPGCLHAFLPSLVATAATATKHHEEGNVGVEHAAPAAIRTALAAPRRSDPQRQAFGRDQLLQWGLVADLHARGGQVTARRYLLCAFLGLGDCDGKQLLRQLNRYCFSLEEVQRALRWAEAQLAAGLQGQDGA